MTLRQLNKLIFDQKHPSSSFDFSNLLMLEFPPLQGDGWRVDEVRITTPVGPLHGIGVTAIHYRDQLVFNFNYKASAAPREQAEALSALFLAAVEEMAAPAK
jgi:hypothetical protein